MIKNWFKIAFKNYKKNWVSTIINIVGLTVGMTGLVIMLLYWNYENSFETWNPESKNVYVAENKVEGMGTMIMSNYPQAKYSTERFDEIEDYTLFSYWGTENLLSNGKKTSYAKEATVTEKAFDFFPFHKVAGNLKNVLIDEQSIVISEKVAKELFGDDYLNAIGESVKNENNTNSYVVKGIYSIPKGEKTVFTPDFLTRETGLNEEYNQNWTNFGVITFFKLKEGTNVKDLERKLTLQQREEQKKNYKKWRDSIPEDELKETEVFLTRLDKMKLYAKSRGIDKGDLKNLKILTVLSLIILLLSAINFINLKTAQSSIRAKEVGVRKAIGSSKTKIILQFLFEAFLICFLSFLLSLVLVELILPSFNKFKNVDVQFNDINILFYLLIGLVLIVLFSGLIPAFYLSSFKPINTLKGNFSRSSQGKWLRNGILTLQIVISSFFIIGSLIINTQLEHMLNKDLGFNADQIIHVSLHKRGLADKYDMMKNTLSNYSNVEEVTYGAQRIGKWVSMASNIQNADSTKNQQVALGAMDINYMRFYDIKFLSGRDFNPKITADTTQSVIINNSLAQSLGWSAEQAIREKIKVDNFDDNHKFYDVIGVVNDFHITGVQNEVTPTIYFDFNRLGWTKNNFRGLDIKLKASNVEETLSKIKEFFETKIEPGYPFEYYFVNKEFAKTFDKYKNQRTLFTILNSIVLIVALLGLFALSALLIEQKLKTVAIKKTLGASDGTLIFGLTKQFLIITVLAVLISFPISYYFMNEWLKDFAYRIEMPWWPYMLSLLLLLALTFAVVSFKAWNATKISLVKYLKYE